MVETGISRLAEFACLKLERASCREIEIATARLPVFLSDSILHR